MTFAIIYIIGYVLCTGALYWAFHKIGADEADHANFAGFMIGGLSAVWPITLLLFAIWYFKVYKDREDDEE